MNPKSADAVLREDHLGRTAYYPAKPARIVSLCPSQTELLFDLGLRVKVVGRTRFCIHPQPSIKAISQVGGTKEVHLDRIRELNPDLILCEKEENTAEMVDALATEYPVYVTDVVDFSSALKMIRDVGTLCGKPADAVRMADKISSLFEEIPPVQGQSAAYFIWKDPWMVVGDHTYIHDILSICGFRNVFQRHGGRYPEIRLEDLRVAQPDHVFLSSEPYPFKDQHIEELKTVIPNADIRLVDGEMFTWYGSRMLKAAPYLKNLLKSLG